MSWSPSRLKRVDPSSRKINFHWCPSPVLLLRIARGRKCKSIRSFIIRKAVLTCSLDASRANRFESPWLGICIPLPDWSVVDYTKWNDIFIAWSQAVEEQRTFVESAQWAWQCVIFIGFARRDCHPKQAIHQVEGFAGYCESSKVRVRIKLKTQKVILEWFRLLWRDLKSHQFVLNFPRLVGDSVINNERKTRDIGDVHLCVETSRRIFHI